MTAQAQKDETPFLQIETSETSDPNLNSLRRYAKLARKYDLIDYPIRREDESHNIIIKSKFGGQTFEFESVAKAVHWLALVYHAADHAVKGT